MRREETILRRDDAPLEVAVLVFDRANILSLAAAVDPLRAANRLAGRRIFAWRFVTPTDLPVHLTAGIDLPAAPLSGLDGAQLLVVVAGFDLARQATAAVRAGLRRIAATGATLAGIDGGPWILAEAGLLNGETATTHWEDIPTFAQRFPEVTVVTDRFRISGARMTCGGATPALDMMLHLIAVRHGAQLAERVAGVFIHDSPTDPSRPQSHLGADPRHSRLTAEAARLMAAHLDATLPVPEIARRLGVSPRTLETRFRSRLGTSPRAYYTGLRLAEALRLVTQTETPLIEVALATGFGSPAAFSRAFRAAHGLAPSALRRR
ncbi:MAG: helix-turn-helix domain-containing protein [Rhodobacteraceae bacterium]|nr:MAG: helix-turn-helix domain-containing protein [Paracoccaceae bacterium]